MRATGGELQIIGKFVSKMEDDGIFIDGLVTFHDLEVTVEIETDDEWACPVVKGITRNEDD